MIYFLFFLVVVIIILIYFLYQIRKDEDFNTNFENSNISDDSSINAEYIKESYINPDNFRQGLNSLDIQDNSIKTLKDEVSKSIIGMDEFLNSFIVNIFSGGHILVEGLPGLAKTKTIDIFSKAMDFDFNRVQFTPDMLPSDIVGVEIFNYKTQEFEVKKGPVFTNILLGDEINRATPKVQSALLESMQEKKVSIGGDTYELPQPFFVLATQNPIEQEGTYELPEAQVDRFLFKMIVDYPSLEQEKSILNNLENEENIHIEKVIDKDRFFDIKDQIKNINISLDIKDYISRLIRVTRVYDERILYGASPRASIGLMFAGKTLAYIQGRNYVIFEDIQKLALNVLRHRIILTYDAKVDGWKEDDILMEILPKVTLE